MKKIISTFFFTYCILIFSQTKNGKILYEVSLLNFNTKEKVKEKLIKDNVNPSTIELIINRSNFENAFYTLLFTESKSVFTHNNPMDSDANPNAINIVEASVGTNTFYYDRKKKEMLIQKKMGEDYYLISSSSIKWKLTNKKKKIGNYLCFEASSSKIVETRRGTVQKNVIAWYTPELPMSLGPNEYRGLPGLIIELKEGNILFSAVKIMLNLPKNTIKKPKGNKIELNKYKELSKLYFKRS